MTVLKATPRPKPRAFPRTNPSYISSHHGDGYSTYRHIGDVDAAVSHVQRGRDLSLSEENPYSLPFDYPAPQLHRPATSHSFDYSDSPSAAALCHPMVFAHCSQKKICILSHRTSNNNNYCWHAIADGNQRIRIREKTLESLSVIYTVFVPRHCLHTTTHLKNKNKGAIE